MFTKVHNIVIAVKDVKEAARQYSDNFGLKASKSGDVPRLGIRNAMFPVGDATLELIEPLDPQRGPVTKFLQTRGEGLYMIELEVENVDKAVKELQKKGVQLLGADPESRAKGSQVFVHPKSTNGVLIQLVQKA